MNLVPLKKLDQRYSGVIIVIYNEADKIATEMIKWAIYK